MNRDRLISEVKEEYAYLAELQSRERHRDNSTIPAEIWYEKRLELVIHRIQAGQFDGFSSGKEIVEAIANNTRRFNIPQ